MMYTRMQQGFNVCLGMQQIPVFLFTLPLSLNARYLGIAFEPYK